MITSPTNITNNIFRSYHYHGNHRFVSHEDSDWFEKKLTRHVYEEMGPKLAAYTEPTKFYVDFLR